VRRARFAILLAAFAAALLAACAPAPRERVPSAPQVPIEFPAAHYEQLIARGAPVYRVDPAQSLVTIEVRRAGSLARLGHDHVVASRDVGGYVAPDEGRADLYVPLDRLSVDEPKLRADAGFDTQPPETDVAGTRANMLDKVLETETHPFALITTRGAARAGEAPLEVAITLHGTKRTLPVPVRIEMGVDDLRASGRLSLDQSDFGIAPFSILGGAIAVRDRVDLRFWITARRAR
jgi:polyisoprenoid-binding protein YceI